MRILIIEDNHYMVQKILSALPDRSPEHIDLVSVVPDLKSAYRIVELLKVQKNLSKQPENHYDILLIDHDLPDGNGTWFLRNYKDKFKYIIAISSIPENNKRLIENGAHDQVLKMEKGYEKIIAKKIQIIFENEDKSRK